MHVGHPYIPLFKSQRIFDLLVYIYMATLLDNKTGVEHSCQSLPIAQESPQCINNQQCHDSTMAIRVSYCEYAYTWTIVLFLLFKDVIWGHDGIPRANVNWYETYEAWPVCQGGSIWLHGNMYRGCESQGGKECRGSTGIYVHVCVVTYLPSSPTLSHLPFPSIPTQHNACSSKPRPPSAPEYSPRPSCCSELEEGGFQSDEEIQKVRLLYSSVSCELQGDLFAVTPFS